nr:hypothetical protein B0A51_00790 [Rachicladosporium sp. CCFEE 5018]
MKFFRSFFAVSLTIAGAAASSCTAAVALSWSIITDASTRGTSGCNGDAGCLAIEGDAACNSQVLISGGTCEKLRVRQTGGLECTVSETCFQYTDGSLLCLDTSTGEYHDDVGGTGSTVSGVYTAPNGQVQTGTGTPSAIAAPSTSATRSGAVGASAAAAARSKSSSFDAVPSSSTSPATSLATSLAPSRSGAATSATTQPSATAATQSGGSAGGAVVTLQAVLGTAVLLLCAGMV